MKNSKYPKEFEASIIHLLINSDKSTYQISQNLHTWIELIKKEIISFFRIKISQKSTSKESLEEDKYPKKELLIVS